MFASGGMVHNVYKTIPIFECLFFALLYLIVLRREKASLEMCETKDYPCQCTLLRDDEDGDSKTEVFVRCEFHNGWDVAKFEKFDIRYTKFLKEDAARHSSLNHPNVTPQAPTEKFPFHEFGCGCELWYPSNRDKARHGLESGIVKTHCMLHSGWNAEELVAMEKRCLHFIEGDASDFCA